MTVENQGSEPLKNCLGGGGSQSCCCLFVFVSFVCCLLLFFGGGCSQDNFGLGILFGGGGGGFSGQHLTFAEHISPFQSRVSFGVNTVHLGVRD